MLIRSEYANRDLGDGVCVVVNNYCSLGTLLELPKEFPTKMAKKVDRDNNKQKMKRNYKKQKTK